MRYLVRGTLREPCRLSAEEYFALAVREWEIVLGWIAQGKALAYRGFGTGGGGAILIEATSEAAARDLARTLPLSPYTELTVSRFDQHVAGRSMTTLLLDAARGGMS